LGEWDDFKRFERLYSKEEAAEPEAEIIKESVEEPIMTLDKIDVAEEKEAERKRQEWLDQLRIFEKYREVREQNALRNWQRHSIEWNRTERLIAKKSGKVYKEVSSKAPEELLMARLGEYRNIVESRDLIEEALLLLEQQNINFWKEGLKIGNDLLGLSFQMPKGGPRQ
jgi:hypothetical protein